MSNGKLDVRPGGLEVLSTGQNLAELDLHGGEGIWDEVARFSRDSLIETQVDAAMAGRASPRVWAIMESPGAGPGAAAAGLAIARVLADRGQAVVLVDGDEQEPRITRWLGRNEMEGWIDMVRFGASLHAASDPLPSDNRRGSVLGVGSFAPTGVTPDEVADLLARLRRQADDLVLVLPAKLRSQPWLEAAHIKLLCWDLLSRSTGDTEGVITELDRMGARPDALLGYGVEEFSAIQGKLREDDLEDGLAPLPPEDVDELIAGEPATPEPTPEQTIVAKPELEPELDPEPETAPMEPAMAKPAPTVTDEEKAAMPADEPVAEEATSPEKPEAKSRRRSSGIFIFVAAVAVVCLVMLGVFLAGQRGRTGGEDGQTVAAARMDSSTGTSGRVTPPPAAAPATEEPAEGDLPAGADLDGDGEATAQTPDEPVVEPATEVTSDDLPAGDAPAETAAPVIQAPAVPPEPAAADPEPVAMDMAPFELPVGQDGWALWLYSFPVLDQAEAEIVELGRRGIRADYRPVEVEGKGTWYRVYVGSFADRGAAKAAVAGLKDKLKHDWVVPARL